MLISLNHFIIVQFVIVIVFAFKLYLIKVITNIEIGEDMSFNYYILRMFIMW